MLQRARQVAPKDAPVDFVLADATVYPFEPASSDLLVSRFGVMFFAEPAVSFANMRKGVAAVGTTDLRLLARATRKSVADDPLQAVYQHVPKLPQLGPEDPGPFSFASEQRVRRILTEAGFSGIAMEPRDLALDIAVGRGLDAAVNSLLEIGPGKRALEGQPAKFARLQAFDPSRAGAILQGARVCYLRIVDGAASGS